MCFANSKMNRGPYRWINHSWQLEWSSFYLRLIISSGVMWVAEQEMDEVWTVGEFIEQITPWETGIQRSRWTDKIMFVHPQNNRNQRKRKWVERVSASAEVLKRGVSCSLLPRRITEKPEAMTTVGTVKIEFPSFVNRLSLNSDRWHVTQWPHGWNQEQNR